MLMVVLLRAMESHPTWAIQSGHVTGTLSLPMNVTGKSAYAVSAWQKLFPSFLLPTHSFAAVV